MNNTIDRDTAVDNFDSECTSRVDACVELLLKQTRVGEVIADALSPRAGVANGENPEDGRGLGDIDVAVPEAALIDRKKDRRVRKWMFLKKAIKLAHTPLPSKIREVSPELLNGQSVSRIRGNQIPISIHVLVHMNEALQPFPVLRPSTPLSRFRTSNMTMGYGRCRMGGAANIKAPDSLHK
jgi:hypothetical protein